MVIQIEQTLTKVAAAEVDVILSVEGEEIFREYKRSNNVFPAYHSLIEVLRGYTDATIHVKTNSKALADEYNATYENRHATHLGNLMQVISRNNIDLAVELVAE